MKFRLIIFTFIISGSLATPPWPSPYWDIPGDYCASKYPRMRCCQGRKDPCNVPILGNSFYSFLLIVWKPHLILQALYAIVTLFVTELRMQTVVLIILHTAKDSTTCNLLLAGLKKSFAHPHVLTEEPQ